MYTTHPSNERSVLREVWKGLIEVCACNGSTVYYNKTVVRGENWHSIAIERHYIFPKQAIPKIGMSVVHQHAYNNGVARAEVSMLHDSSQVQGSLTILYGIEGTNKPYLSMVTLGKHQLPANVGELCVMPSRQRVRLR